MNRTHRIEKILSEALSPSQLFIHDETHLHHVPQHSETHFKLIMASNAFAGLTLIQRHRQVNHLLAEEFKQGLHALSLHLYTPEEWQHQKTSALNSPPCRDGYGS